MVLKRSRYYWYIARAHATACHSVCVSFRILLRCCFAAIIVLRTFVPKSTHQFLVYVQNRACTILLNFPINFHNSCFLDDDTMMMHGHNLPVLFVSARTSLHLALADASRVCTYPNGCNYAARARRAICAYTFTHTLPLPCSEYFLPAFMSGYNSPLLFALASLQRVNHIPDTCLHKSCWHVPAKVAQFCHDIKCFKLTQ